MATNDIEIERGSLNGETIFDITRTKKRAHIIIRKDNYTKRSLYTIMGFFIAS